MKAVRDNYRQTMPKTTYIAPTPEFLDLLEQKLVEEAQEVIDAPPERKMEELADLQAVIEELMRRRHWTRGDIFAAMARKGRARGFFPHNVVWTEMSEADAQ